VTEHQWRSRLEQRFWDRHANPKSGWSRVLLGPLIVLAVYRRDRRLLLAVALATILNPVLFPPVDSDPDDWMTRAVRAEQWWLQQGHGTFGTDWPNVLNTVNVPTFVYALVAAYARQPRRATLGLVASMALKFGWIELIARRYDTASDDGRSVAGVDTSSTAADAL
jgi:hypothetical protein